MSVRLRAFAALALGACASVLVVSAPAAKAAGSFVPDNTIETYAGFGDRGPWGDGGRATAASLALPSSVAMAADGSLFIADTQNNRVRKVDAGGVMRFVAGNFTAGGFSGDGGHPSGANLRAPSDVAIGPDGSLYIADSGNARIRRVAPDGLTITTFAGGGSCGGGTCGDGGPAGAAQLVSPTGVAAARDGSVYIADGAGKKVRKVAPGGIITTVAGTGSDCAGGPCGDGGPAASAVFGSPAAVDVSWDGTVYVVDTATRRVRQISPAGAITAFAGTGAFDHTGDGGPAVAAAISNPSAVEVTRDGSVLISESHWGTVRRVDPAGVITTVAGDAVRGWGFSGDGGVPTLAQLDGPAGLAVGRDGAIYVADRENDRIRAFKAAAWNPNGPTPSAPAVISPANGAFVASATPTLAATTVPAAEVMFSIDGLPVATVTADGSGGASTTSAALAEGVHVLTATVSVNGSLSSLPSAPRTFTVDTVVPGAPTVLGGFDGTRAAFTLTAEPGAALECSIDGGSWAPCTTDLTLTGLSVGEHTLDVRQTDVAGNTSAPARRGWTVAAPSIDPPQDGGGETPKPTEPAPLPVVPTPVPAPGAAEVPRAVKARIDVARKVKNRREVAVSCRLDQGTVKRCQIEIRHRGRVIGAKTVAVRGTQSKATVRVTLNQRGRQLISRSRTALRITVRSRVTTQEGRTLRATTTHTIRR